MSAIFQKMNSKKNKTNRKIQREYCECFMIDLVKAFYQSEALNCIDRKIWAEMQFHDF
jgi:hypothetical protein